MQFGAVLQVRAEAKPTRCRICWTSKLQEGSGLQPEAGSCSRVAGRANLRVSPGPGVLELAGDAEVGKLRLEPWKLHPEQ